MVLFKVGNNVLLFTIPIIQLRLGRPRNYKELLPVIRVFQVVNLSEPTQ